MTVIAIFIALLLAAIALLHLYWGMGGVWPGTDAASCAKIVVGSANIRSMPGPVACFGVALALLLAALLLLSGGGLMALPMPEWLVKLALAGGALVLLLRGIAGFTTPWRRLAPEQPFARLDRQYYSPLCLLLGAGFAVVWFFANPA